MVREGTQNGPRASLVVPTYGRHDVLIDTLERLLALTPAAHEVVVVDQTRDHPEAVEARLNALERKGTIRLLRRARPSIPGAMNDGLQAARGEVVIFCDDDVDPVEDFIAAHVEAHARWPRSIVAGQVLQPGEVPAPLTGGEFTHRSTKPQTVTDVIGCNFSSPRELLLEIGGFDECFVAAAYRYERELCDRAMAAGIEIRFEPSASLRHLRAPRGGTRAWGDHLRTLRPSHSVGEYYYLLRASGRRGRWGEFMQRPFRAVRTRHHVKHPWWIPGTLFAEVAGAIWALALAAGGPRLLKRSGASS